MVHHQNPPDKQSQPMPSPSGQDHPLGEPPPPYSHVSYRNEGRPDAGTTKTSVNTSESEYTQQLHLLIQSNEDIFKNALEIIMDKFNDDYREERKWLLKKHEHDENKPPEALENLCKYLEDKSNRLNSGIFSKTVRHFRQSESGLRHLAIVVDSVLSLLPEPARTPAGAVFGIIKFTLKLVFNHKDLMEKVCLDFNMILQKIEAVNWTLASYRSDPRIRFGAVKLYLSILRYWCKGWYLFKAKRHIIERILNFPNTYQADFENLKTAILYESERLREALLTISLEKAKNAETCLEKISDVQDIERLERLFTPDSTAESRSKSASVLNKKFRTRYPGTCCWIEDSPKVLEWLNTDSGKDFLWIHALAGAGKSVTAAYVVDSLIAHRRWADQEGVCLYFFCEHSNLVQASHQEVVKALLLQILEFVCLEGRVIKKEKAVFERLHAFEGSDFVKLDDRTAEKFSSLLSCMAEWGTIWIILDGIDEYEDSEIKQVLRFLAKICAGERSNVKVMIFSRPERFIVDWLRFELPESKYIATEIPADKVRHDLRLYAKSRIIEILERIEPQYSPAQKDKVADELIDKLLSTEVGDRAPLFLWVSEMINAMELASSLHGINSLFGPNSIPNRLYGLYARSLMRIEMTNAINTPELERIFQLLCWAVYSRQQPLAMHTLKAISVGGKRTAVDIKSWINSTCSSLFVWRLNDEDHIEEDTLHFHHLSVKEFLRQPPDEVQRMCRAIEIFQKGEIYKEILHKANLILSPEKAHKCIFDDCITYLLTATNQKGSLAFERPLVATRGDAVRIADISKRFPFFPYAAKFWPYHLRRTEGYEERSSRCLLERFFQSPNVYSWMEGMISSEGGTQWLRMQASVIRTWLRDRDTLKKCPNFRNWAEDVTGKGFSDYEPTLRYNPNDIHFLDCQILFNRFVGRTDWVSKPGRDVIIDLAPEDDESQTHQSSGFAAQLQSSPEGSGTDDQSAMREFYRNGTLVLPKKPLDLGENDEEYGFLELDHNKPGHRGLLMIDRRVNDPRLAWKCVNPESSAKELELGIIPKGVCLESKIETCIKVDPHKLWLTLSATVDYAGSMLAAVFGETVPATKQVPRRVRLKTIVWRFVPENPQQYTLWKDSIRAARSKYIEAVNNTFAVFFQSQPGQATREAKRRALEQVENAGRDVRRTMAQRPSLPSHVLCQTGDFWATREELYRGTDDYDNVDVIIRSRYLLAFRDDNQLITPRGIWDLNARQYSVDYPSQAFETQFVAVPGGDDILKFQDASLTVLNIINPEDFVTRGQVCAKSLGEFTRFGKIIDCSQSGRLVALTIINVISNVTSLAVLDLYQRTYKILLDDAGRTDNFEVRRFFFCPKDAHGTIICSNKVIQERFEWFVVDFPRGIIQQFRSSNTGVSTVFCTREDCSYNGSFHSISPTPLPIIASIEEHEAQGPGATFKPTFREVLFSLDEQQNAGIAIQRWKTGPTERGEHAQTGRTQRSCGIAGIVWADRKTSIEVLDLRRRKDSNLRQVTDGISFRKQTCRSSFVNLREIAAANMLVQANRVESASGDIPHRTSTLMEAKIAVELFLWEMSSSTCTVDPATRKRIDPTLDRVLLTRQDMTFSGICVSPDLELLTVWIGTHIWFLRVKEEGLALIPSSIKSLRPDPEVLQRRCVDIRFNAAKGYAVAIWSSEIENTDTHHKSNTDALLVYSFQDESYTLESEIKVDCNPRWYCFHPTETLMAVTTPSGLRLYDMSDLGAPVLLREIPTGVIQTRMRIQLSKTDGGKASPPSTRDSLSSISSSSIGPGQEPLYFSSCGRYLFTRTWDTFAMLSDILDLGSSPQCISVLDFFAAQSALSRPIGGPWVQISTQHPRVMYEDVLYSAGQQRFKIFRIRTYISLGWSADGANFFVTSQDQPPPKFTWYRRVLCAIPKAFASWSATLLWPSEDSRYERLVVVMFPTGGETALAGHEVIQRPKVIFTPLTGEDLVPDESFVDESGTIHLHGWIRSQAAGCAYHLRHDPGAKKVEVPKAASVNGVVEG